MLQRVVVCAADLTLATGAVAQNTINQWSGEPNDVYLDQFNARVVIQAPGTFGFEAFDPNGPGGLGVFQEIAVDDDCPAGTVNVYILRDPNQGGGPGAVHVYYLHLLDATNVTGNISELNITGSLGEPNHPTEATNAGALTVGGSLNSDLVITHDITGNMTIGGLGGNISCDSMQDLTDTRSEEPVFTPSITVRGPYSHTISVTRALHELDFGGEMSGTVEIGRSLYELTITTGGLSGALSTGTSYDLTYFWITGPVSGSISVGGEVWGGSIDGNVSGTLTIGTDLGDTYHWNYVEIDGDVNGTAESPALISIGQDLVSKLAVSGCTGPYASIEIERDVKNHGSYVGLQPGWLYGDVLIGNNLQGWCTLIQLAEGGSIAVTGDMPGYIRSGRTFAGQLTVGDDMSGSVTLDNPDPSETPHLTGSIAIAGDLSGQISVRGTLGAPTDPNDPQTGGYIAIDGAMESGAWIEFGQEIGGSIEVGEGVDGMITTDEGFSGRLSIADSFVGQLTVGGDFDGSMSLLGPTLGGTISIGGDFTADGQIITNGAVSGSWTTGAIEIAGALSGTINIFRLGDPPFGRGGYIRVNGAFDDPGQITLAGPVAGPGSYVTFGYPGWNENVFWDPNAVINVRDPNDPNNVTVYTENAPAAKLYCITSCRGDLNNDNRVDTSDVRPFLLALNYPEDYAETYPGLAGSMVYHGDADCDQDLDQYDQAPFMVLVQRHCCDPECPGCEDQDGLGLPPPEEFAADLAADVSPELYDELLDLITDVINAQEDDSAEEYWQAVYAALTE